MRISEILAREMGVEAAEELARGLESDLAIYLRILPNGKMLITRNSEFTKAVIVGCRIAIDFEIDGKRLTARNSTDEVIPHANHGI